MFVKVQFPTSTRRYTYLYNLASKPKVGDFFIVKSPFGFNLVECMEVCEGEAPKIATKYPLLHFSRKTLNRLDKKKNLGVIV